MFLRATALAVVITSALLSGPAFSQSQASLTPAYASTNDEDLPVMARPRPEYDAKGIPLGGFRIFPTVNVSGTYDTNIFRTELAPVDDYFINTAPSVRLLSQWNRHMLEFYGGISDYSYVTNTTEDLTDWNAGAAGRYDIAGGTSLYIAGSAAELHEPRSSPNVVGFQASPSRYFKDHGEAAFTFQPNRLGFTFGGIVDSYRYANTPLLGGGFQLNGDRDYLEYQGYTRAFYDFSPGYTGFLRAAYDTRQFNQRIDRSGFRRSSNGYRIDAGVDMQISRLLSGEIYIGYLEQHFIAPLKDVSGLDYNFELDWLATPLLTVHLSGGRTLNQVLLAGASVSDDKSVRLSADYELYRNLILQAHAGFVDTTYPGITRHDETPDFGLGARYLVNRYLSANINYSYGERATNVVGSAYRGHLVTVGITLHD